MMIGWHCVRKIAGKSCASRNALRHGLVAFTYKPAAFAEVERIAKAIVILATIGVLDHFRALSPYCCLSPRDPPVRSHDRVPMGRERNTGRRSDICAHRGQV
jgi:hypothetical protein